MASIPILSVIEECQISPPPATVGEQRLPLTFFDMVWLQFTPIHNIFFYEFSHSTHHFIENFVPNLKKSLSVTLKHYFPFAGNFIFFPTPSHTEKPEIRYTEGDSVALTFAECSLDFRVLTGNHPRNCDQFYPLVPSLGAPTKSSDFIKVPLFSVQVTIFPNSGISIGMTNHHVLGDASNRFGFLNAWTSIARFCGDDSFLANGSLPCYNRVISGTNSLDEIYLKKLRLEEGYQVPHLVGPTDKVRATFVLTRATTNELKKKTATQFPTLQYVSSFTVTCGYVWSCMAKSRVGTGEEKGKDELEIFGFAVDCRARLNPPLPPTYFGNCVAPCVAIGKTAILKEKEGFLTAARLLGESLQEMVSNKDGILKDAVTWVDIDLERFSAWMGVAGTPKLKFYDIDFGWGRPKKYETISIDYDESISLNACKDSAEDFEIGVSLPAIQMEAFASIFNSGLQTIFL